MRDNTCFYVLMMTDNEIDKIDRTIQSVLEQTYPMERIRIMVIDNSSIDGTYEKLIQYEIQYPQLISVMREKKKTTRGRLLKKMVEHLRFSTVDASTLLNPGDVIYPNFIKLGVEVLRLNNMIKLVAFETELFDGTFKKAQAPIYSENCIITNMCAGAYYRNGIGHKVQVIFRKLPLPEEIKLPYYALLAEHKEWFTLSYFRNFNCMYRREIGGCIFSENEKDIVSQLIKKAFYYKRSCYAIETNVFSNLYANDTDVQQVHDGYRCLAIMGLQSAIKELESNSFKSAEDCLIFAEMMDLSIVQEAYYEKINQVLLARETNQCAELKTLLESKTCYPPRESYVF